MVLAVNEVVRPGFSVAARLAGQDSVGWGPLRAVWFEGWRAGMGCAGPRRSGRGGQRMESACDASLERHLQCVERYMQGCALLTYPRVKSPLRTELAAFLRARLSQAVDDWITLACPAFGIPESQWVEVADWLREAMVRWVRHIEDPENIDTYVYLRNHARRGFISHFPASRFIS